MTEKEAYDLLGKMEKAARDTRAALVSGDPDRAKKEYATFLQLADNACAIQMDNLEA